MNHYHLIKRNKKGQMVFYESKKTLGFSVKPKEELSYEGVEVSKVILMDPKIVEKVLKRKIKIKLNKIIQYIISLIDDEDTGSQFNIAMDEISRHRSIIINNYARYLEKQYVEMVLKKLDLLEEEIRRKKIYADFQEELEMEQKGKAR